MSIISRVRVPVLAASVALAVGCGDSTSPGASDPAQFTQEITYEEFQQTVTQGEPVRVEIKVLSAAGGSPYVARALEIGEPEDLADREYVKSRVVAVNLTGACEGTLELEMEGVVVEFSDASTQFRRDDGADLTCQQFVDLAGTGNPEIKAKRDPEFDAGLPVPQAPDDPVFAAMRIQLDDEASDAKIELNIDSDNLLDCSSLTNAPAGCQGVLQVLNVLVVLQQGTTEIDAKLDDDRDGTEFEGLVESVSLDPNNSALGSVTLTDGRVIEIVEGTQIEGSSDDEHLNSLSEVDAALQAGLAVEAEGEGVVDNMNGGTVILAHEIEFEVEDEASDDDDGPPGSTQFEGTVTAADVTARTFTLGDGTVISLPDDDRIDARGDMLTLQAVADALAAGASTVRAEGHAVLEGTDLVAVSAKFETDD